MLQCFKVTAHDAV